MARPTGSRTRRKTVPVELGAQGSYCDLNELIEKIGEVVHEDARITAVFLTDSGERVYRIVGEADYEMESKNPVIFTDTVALLEEVIKQIKEE